jgi:multidrug efflux pump subunit AcrA (membrane-fusion protein)
MTTKKQLIVSAGIVLAAVLTLALWALFGADDESESMANGATMDAMDDAISAEPDADMVMLDAEQARRIGVAFTTARLAPLRTTVRTVGNVTYDETRLVTVDPKVEGWVERLYVDFTGAPVQRSRSTARWSSVRRRS